MTSIHRVTVVGLLLLTAVGASACANNRAPAGLSGQIPDDFRVVARAALVVPPEYALRPPVPGEPRPQELQPETAARAALITLPADTTASAAERLLVTKSGGDEASPLIKAIIDDEQGDLAHKSRSFANLVMFWQPGQSQVAATDPNEAAAPIDAAAEAARITALTGNQGIIISKTAPVAQRRGFKLPGL